MTPEQMVRLTNELYEKLCDQHGIPSTERSEFKIGHVYDGRTFNIEFDTFVGLVRYQVSYMPGRGVWQLRADGDPVSNSYHDTRELIVMYLAKINVEGQL